MTFSPILLILGAGPNVATSTAALFAAQGYKVALVSRGFSASFDPSYTHIRADLTAPGTVHKAFAEVKAKFGNPPNVVIHNGASIRPPVYGF